MLPKPCWPDISTGRQLGNNLAQRRLVGRATMTDQNTIVHAPAGTIEGKVKNETLLFAGIPYAQAPLERLRFKAPKPLPPFTETFQALKFSPAAPQIPSGGMTDSAPVRWSEDCLYLNISAPIAVTDPRDLGGRPVIVWIHGGGYTSGQGAIPWYNGTRFAKNNDILVVSINYRLGALGFADLTHLGEEFATSNINGTLDQIAALTWVKQNISAFGGDPERITIAGESAGGFSVATLMACPEAAGLFRQAIPQSGACHHTLPQDAARTATDYFLKELGHATPMALEAASVEDILAAQNATLTHFARGAGKINALGTFVSPFYPVHGNTTLPKSPLEALEAGASAEVAVLTGSNADETTLWSSGDEDLAKLERTVAGYQAESALAVYRKTRPDADVRDLLVALTSDHMFRIPAIRMAEVRQSAAPTFLYEFAWRSRAFNGALGATHSLEIPFAFDNLDQAGVDLFLGPGPVPQGLADTMHKAWSDFIKTGNPGWPRYDLSSRSTMIFDDTCELANNPKAEEREAWDGIR
jgi:para-nitrobenzyl esterase